MAIARYNWEQVDWPNFRYKASPLKNTFLQISAKDNAINYIAEKENNADEFTNLIDLIATEAIKTAAIEGDFFSRRDVVSSIKKKLGVPQKAHKLENKFAANISNFTLAARNTYAKPLSKAMLFQWHSILFENYTNLEIGNYRTHAEAMQIISGALGKEKIHFEAPASSTLASQMKFFIQWFNNTAPNGITPIKNVVVRAAIAHLYFLSIHPFEDGNGRIGRALAEKVFSQAANKPVLLCLSYAIEKEKKAYYTALQKAQQHNEVTPWLHYFTHTVYKAQLYTEKHLQFALKQNTFLKKWNNALNPRQLKVIRKILEYGFEGFEGGMNAQKYMGITKASKATATRDLQELQTLKIFKMKGGGRSTSYELVV